MAPIIFQKSWSPFWYWSRLRVNRCPFMGMGGISAIGCMLRITQMRCCWFWPRGPQLKHRRRKRTHESRTSQNALRYSGSPAPARWGQLCWFDHLRHGSPWPWCTLCHWPCPHSQWTRLAPIRDGWGRFGKDCAVVFGQWKLVATPVEPQWRWATLGGKILKYFAYLSDLIIMYIILTELKNDLGTSTYLGKLKWYKITYLPQAVQGTSGQMPARRSSRRDMCP